MKVILLELITAPGSLSAEKWGRIPLAAGFLKAAVSADASLGALADVEVLNEVCNSDEREDQLVRKIVSNHPAVLGVSLYPWSLLAGLSVIGKVKRESSQVKIVVGGPEVFPDNKHVCGASGIDVMVVGEGEETFVDVLKHFLHGRPALSEIQGLFYRMDGGLRVNALRSPIQDLDVIPSPYLTGLVKPTEDFMWVQVGRGCPFRCKFCSEWIVRQGRISYFSTERIREEVRMAHRERVKIVKLEIPTFNANRRKMTEICEALRDVNADNAMAFAVELRADLVDEETARMLELANVRHLELGLETITASALKGVERDMDMARYLEGISLLHRHGLHGSVNLLIGLPGDTLKTIERTFRFLRENGVNKVASVNANVVCVGPGTALRQQAAEYGIEYREFPPYVTTKTSWMSPADIRQAMFQFNLHFSA